MLSVALTSLVLMTAPAPPVEVTRFADESLKLLPASARVLTEPVAGQSLGFGGFPQLATYHDRQDPVMGPVGEMVLTQRPPQPYNVIVHTPMNTAPIAKGDTVAFVVAIRGVGLRVGEGMVTIYAERNTPTWTSLGQWAGPPPREWQRVWVVGEAKEDFAPGTVNLSMHLGGAVQTVQVGPMAAWNLGKVTNPRTLPVNKLDYDGRDPKAPWRAEAAQRIERIRKGNLTVRVVDSRGRPVPRANVQVRQTRNAFEFGSFCEQPALEQTPNGQKYREWFKRMFNKGTAPMYWADWGWLTQKDAYLGICDFLQREKIPIKGHPLIYPGWEFLPTSLRQLEKDPPAMRKAMLDHMQEKLDAVRKYNFVSWDVLNELRWLKDLSVVFGGDQIYVDLFKETKRMDPKPTLYLNENTILTNGGNTTLEQDEYERMLRYLIQNGAPVEGIGFQGHFNDHLTPPKRLWEILDRFAKFRVPLQITEYDLPIRDLQAQADYTRDFLTAMYAHEAVTGVTIWGFWEGQMWQPQGALIDKDWNLLPNGRVWLDLTERQWMTRSQGVTNTRGQLQVRGFTGSYDVTVTAPGGTPRKGTAKATLNRLGTLVTVTVR